jgi:HEAT repeat protein
VVAFQRNLVVVSLVPAGLLVAWLAGADGDNHAQSPEKQKCAAPEPRSSEPARDAHRAALGSDAAVEVAFFADAAVPLEQRQVRIDELASGDDADAQTLMELGEARVYLSTAAVRALGHHPAEQVVAYLEDKLDHPDPEMVRAAADAYARAMGEEAVAVLVETLEANRERADGWDQEVCTDIVRILGELGTRAATDALIAELERSNELGWNLGYGSQVVRALDRIGAPDGRTALLAYAHDLGRRQPSDPLAARYFEDKIAEARRAAGAP